MEQFTLAESSSENNCDIRKDEDTENEGHQASKGKIKNLK